MKQNKKKRILICPLDWGIGHATRCIPIINILREKKMDIVIGADNKPLALLKKEFPELEFIRYPSYKISYPSNNKMAFKMLQLLPSILSGIKKENKFLEEAVAKYKIDAVISDNRFGASNKSIPSIYITHQITIKTPPALKWLEPLLYRMHMHYINKYHCCWVPDYTGRDALAGELSNKKTPGNATYIGPLSRFSNYSKSTNNNTWPVVAIISGPEPQRSIFRNIIINELKSLDKQCLVLAGEPDQEYEEQVTPKIMVKSHMESREFYNVIMNAEVVISRSGYSSIMDLSFTGKKAILIPTPGQSEQEYLANYHMQENNFLAMNQNSINLKKAILQLENYSGIRPNYNKNLIICQIDKLIKLIQ